MFARPLHCSLASPQPSLPVFWALATCSNCVALLPPRPFYSQRPRAAAGGLTATQRSTGHKLTAASRWITQAYGNAMTSAVCKLNLLAQADRTGWITSQQGRVVTCQPPPALPTAPLRRCVPSPCPQDSIVGHERLPRPRIEPGTLRSSVRRSPSWAIAACAYMEDFGSRYYCFLLVAWQQVG